MLTDAKIKSAKPRETPYKLFDEKGLYLLITPAGGRLFQIEVQGCGGQA